VLVTLDEERLVLRHHDGRFRSGVPAIRPRLRFISITTVDSAPASRPSDHACASSPYRYRIAVGYNPFRVQVKHRGDLLIVISALVVVAALVAWATFG